MRPMAHRVTPRSISTAPADGDAGQWRPRGRPPGDMASIWLRSRILGGGRPPAGQDLPLTRQDLPLTRQDLPLTRQDLPLTRQDLLLTRQELPPADLGRLAAGATTT